MDLGEQRRLNAHHVHKSFCQVWFLRVYRARGLVWSSSVVLHDSWCVVVLLKDIIVEWHPKLSHFEENLHPNLSHPNRRSCSIFVEEQLRINRPVTGRSTNKGANCAFVQFGTFTEQTHPLACWPQQTSQATLLLRATPRCPPSFAPPPYP